MRFGRGVTASDPPGTSDSEWVGRRSTATPTNDPNPEGGPRDIWGENSGTTHDTTGTPAVQRYDLCTQSGGVAFAPPGCGGLQASSRSCRRTPPGIGGGSTPEGFAMHRLVHRCEIFGTDPDKASVKRAHSPRCPASPAPRPTAPSDLPRTVAMPATCSAPRGRSGPGLTPVATASGQCPRWHVRAAGTPPLAAVGPMPAPLHRRQSARPRSRRRAWQNRPDSRTSTLRSGHYCRGRGCPCGRDRNARTRGGHPPHVKRPHPFTPGQGRSCLYGALRASFEQSEHRPGDAAACSTPPVGTWPAHDRLSVPYAALGQVQRAA